MSAYGLHKATAYYNKIEALKDWADLVNAAKCVRVAENMAIAPKPEFGWKRIDKCTAKLRELIEKYQQVTK